jgi:hypothetical protein
LSFEKSMTNLMKPAMSFKHPLNEREKPFETHSISLKFFNEIESLSPLSPLLPHSHHVTPHTCHCHHGDATMTPRQCYSECVQWYSDNSATPVTTHPSTVTTITTSPRSPQSPQSPHLCVNLCIFFEFLRAA